MNIDRAHIYIEHIHIQSTYIYTVKTSEKYIGHKHMQSTHINIYRNLQNEQFMQIWRTT